MEWIASPEAWIALFTLTVLEIVLGIDNIIFISILVDRLPEHQQKKARLTGLALAMVIAVGVMMLAAEAIGEFVENNPTIKMLALSFLILVGTALLGEGMGFHIPKGYIYFAMAFAVGVELLNLKMRKNAEKPVKLTRHNP